MQRSSLALGIAGLAVLVSVGSLATSSRVYHELKDWENAPATVSPESVRAALLADPHMLLDASRKLQQEAAEDRRIASMQLVEAARAELAQPTAGFLGNPDGTQILTVFFDYQCPHCRDAEPALHQMVKDQPGLKIILRDIPVLGEGSELAARAALAAASQNLYMPMHDALMKAPVPITREEIVAAATGVGADLKKLDADMGSDAVTKTLEDTIRLSRRIGMTGTPGFAMPGRGFMEGFQNKQALDDFIAGKQPPKT